MPTDRMTHDPLTGREIAADDDYDYTADILRDDAKRRLTNDVESVQARQREANARGEPYFPTPWECWHLGKWWNVPSEEHEELMMAETAEHPWQDMIERRLDDPTLYAGRLGETPTRWDGTLADTTDWGNTVTITRIGVQWLAMTPDMLGRGMNATKTISAIMRKLGWTLRRQRIPGQTSMPWVWVNPDSLREELLEMAASQRERERPDDDDVPF